MRLSYQKSLSHKLRHSFKISAAKNPDFFCEIGALPFNKLNRQNYSNISPLGIPKTEQEK